MVDPFPETVCGRAPLFADVGTWTTSDRLRNAENESSLGQSTSMTARRHGVESHWLAIACMSTMRVSGYFANGYRFVENRALLKAKVEHDSLFQTGERNITPVDGGVHSANSETLCVTTVSPRASAIAGDIGNPSVDAGPEVSAAIDPRIEPRVASGR